MKKKEKEFYRCVEQVFHLVKVLHVLSIIDWRTLLSAETYLYKLLIMWFSFLPLRNCSLVTISVILSYAIWSLLDNNSHLIHRSNCETELESLDAAIPL